jgi:sterol desaturase/sphingolipid hydroxylase (fatty acid hydroxylase superfamily)
MSAMPLPATWLTIDTAVTAKRALAVCLLLAFWCWETRRPFRGRLEGRWRHACQNLVIALANTLILGLLFVSVTLAVIEWTQHNGSGLLHAGPMPYAIRFVLGLVLLDLWMYVWHRANHAIPLLWRFHRMHHSDRRVDVTTATRFHLGEHVGASLLRLGLIPLAGLDVWQLLAYDTLVLAVTQFHHADISIGRLDAWLRWVIVTPHMHKVHHSDWAPETNSNYATVFSIWDRLFGSFRIRPDPRTLVYGLNEFAAPRWQTVWGMLQTPFVATPSPSVPHRTQKAETGTHDAGHARQRV